MYKTLFDTYDKQVIQLVKKFIKMISDGQNKMLIQNIIRIAPHPFIKWQQII